MILGRKDDYTGKSSMVNTLPGYNLRAETGEMGCIVYVMPDMRYPHMISQYFSLSFPQID